MTALWHRILSSMTAVEHLRDAVRAQVDAAGLGPVAARTGLPIGKIRSIYAGRSPLGSTIQQVCAALDLEFYIGPPRSVNSAPIHRSSPDDDPPEADIVRVPDPRLAEILRELSRHFSLLNDPGREALLARLGAYFPDLLPHFQTPELPEE